MHFLDKISDAMWHAFFFFPKILGALFMGNGIYILCALSMFAGMIIIESFVLQRFIKSKLQKILPRFFYINLMEIAIQAIVAFPLLYLVDLQNPGLTILAAIILLFFRIITAYFLYTLFDKFVNKGHLKKGIILANVASYVFVVAIYLISRLSGYNFI